MMPKVRKLIVKLDYHNVTELPKRTRGGNTLTKTNVKKGENIDDALRRFKRSVSKSGTLREARKRERYEKPSVKRKKKSEEARKRNRRSR